MLRTLNDRHAQQDVAAKVRLSPATVSRIARRVRDDDPKES
ncbi:hypothetical protein Dalu01_02228 [Deinococcus aluminii]|uniref:Uncharacterized protein n=1 Tax=Deinococcus aluminii TaxID=1656885 RepID=A0ABP9XEM7_9DEIO